MNPKYLKLLIACFIALVGLLALGRMLLLRASAPAGTAEVQQLSDAGLEIANGGFDTKPDATTVDSHILAASKSLEALVAQMSGSSLPASRRSDLPTAFQERLAAVIDPNPSRDATARARRGQPAAEVPDYLTNLQSIYQYRAFDIESIQLVTVYQNGRRLIPDDVSEDGLNLSTTRLLRDDVAFPLANRDPIADRLHIVEVRLPMDVPVPPPDESRSERRLVGFQFVWNRDSNQWVPWANVTRGGTGGTFGVPF